MFLLAHMVPVLVVIGIALALVGTAGAGILLVTTGGGWPLVTIGGGWPKLP